MGFGFKLAAGIFVTLALATAGFVWYYNDTQRRMAILVESNAELEIAIQTSEQTIGSLQEDYDQVVAENDRINQDYAEIRRQNDRLSEKLADVDLGLLAQEKPEAIERVVNRGTENASRCFELLSGSPLTEEEYSATDAEDFNKECPWIFNDLRSRGLLD